MSTPTPENSPKTPSPRKPESQYEDDVHKLVFTPEIWKFIALWIGGAAVALLVLSIAFYVDAAGVNEELEESRDELRKLRELTDDMDRKTEQIATLQQQNSELRMQLDSLRANSEVAEPNSARSDGEAHSSSRDE